MEYAIVPTNEIVHSRYSAEHNRSYSQDMFNELSKSIRIMGVHDPLCVTRKNAEGKYVIMPFIHCLRTTGELFREWHDRKYVC